MRRLRVLGLHRNLDLGLSWLRLRNPLLDGRLLRLLRLLRSVGLILCKLGLCVGLPLSYLLGIHLLLHVLLSLGLGLSLRLGLRLELDLDLRLELSLDLGLRLCILLHLGLNRLHLHDLGLAGHRLLGLRSLPSLLLSRLGHAKLTVKHLLGTCLLNRLRVLLAVLKTELLWHVEFLSPATCLRTV